MKKKFMAMMMACVMILGCSLTAFASESPTLTNVENAVIGNTGSYTIGSYSDKVKVSVDNSVLSANMFDTSSIWWNGIMETEKLIDAYIGSDGSISNYDVMASAMEITSDEAGPYVLIIESSCIKPSSEIFVMHYINDTWVRETNYNEWDQLDGCLYVSVDSLSPFIIVTLNEKEAADETTDSLSSRSSSSSSSSSSDSGSSADDGSVSSPKTGDMFNVYLVLFVAAAVAAVVTGKKAVTR